MGLDKRKISIMTKTITVGLITHKEGAHVHAYLNALRDSVNCDRVVLVDPDHAWDEPAQRILTTKLQGRYDSLDCICLLYTSDAADE